MAGITSYGAYIPVYRIAAEAFARAWGTRYMAGEKAVAFYDEDSVTMSTAAAADCLGYSAPSEPDGLFLASTTLPYKEKQMATLIAEAMDFPNTTRAVEFTNTLRCATSAMNSALDAIKAGSLKNVLVTAADCRMGTPASVREQQLGDGGAAVMFGDTDVAVEIESSYTFNKEITDVWRKDGERFIAGWEDRWAILFGYQEPLKEAVNGLLQQSGLTPSDFSGIVIPAPDYRSHRELVANLGFDPKTQSQDPLFGTIGATGAAHALMILVAALEQATAGDRILFANYGNGADAFVLRVTEHIEKAKRGRGISGHLASKRPLNSYERYMRWHGLVEVEGSRRQPPFSSPTVLWREGEALLPFRGSRCRQCGLIDFPPQRICYQCGSKDDYDLIKLPKTGKLFTFTEDYLSGAAVEDFIGNPVIDLDGGGRMRTLMTECEAGEMRIDMPIELVFRKLHDGGGYPNYFWKARPVR